MTNVITRIIDSRDFRNMSADARLLFYDLYYRAGEDRKFSYQNVDAIIDMTNSSRAAFNELYDNHFMILNIDGSYGINRYFGMWDVIKDAGTTEVKKAFPPTVEDVKAYRDEIGSRVDANKFVDYYTANGWQIKGKLMKDWKAAFRIWDAKEKPKEKDNGLCHSFDGDEFWKLALKRSEEYINEIEKKYNEKENME